MLNYVKKSDASKSKKMILDSTNKEECFLMIVSAHSEEYRLNRSKVLRRVAESEEGFTDKNQAMITAEMISGAVVGWKLPKDAHEEFGEDCTPENVAKLLLQYPQIADAVDVFSSKDSQFIEKKSKA